ncbi:hypothetical protein KP509_01G115700 [Ceratopteris richardii]|uniref:Uncharacterized protein n=1 Tax=Ceratopteris richardii TaxID=49495 RepID=A0A8T2VK71_CERRI|nr:hypothetical protein KP509_01G115700 [Ceratopteris richardii]
MKAMLSATDPTAPQYSDPSSTSETATLLDAMEEELLRAHRMVQELKNAPRASPRSKRQRPCSCCMTNSVHYAVQQTRTPHDANGVMVSSPQYIHQRLPHAMSDAVAQTSDVCNISPYDSFRTPPPLHRAGAHSNSTGSSTQLFTTPRRGSRSSSSFSHVSHKLFDESSPSPDGLMLAVDKFLAAGDFFSANCLH